MKKYILLYGDKKLEDNICIRNMFEKNKQINLGWTDFDYKNNKKIIEEQIKSGIEQIIFSGLEIGWGKLIRDIKKEHKNIIIKVICNTADSLLYYEYERNNFFELLELSKENIIEDIAFLRKGQYEVYKKLGYKCSYLMQNYELDKSKIKKIDKESNVIELGIYPLNYTWDKNIFNQLCVAKMLDNVIVNYNMLDERMKDFLDTMKVNSKEDKIEKIEEDDILEKIIKNDITLSCSFTEYFHTIFFISMEQGIPCIIGNTSDLFTENDELRQYVVTEAEDNPIINAELVNKCLSNKEKVIKLYQEWKNSYNKLAHNSKNAFLEK